MQKLLISFLLISQFCFAVTLVTNVPNVEVRLGSVLLGVTDRNGVAQIEVSLPATLTFAKPGYLTRSVYLEDPEKSYFITLIASANLQILSTPSGASVWINGKSVGQTPFETELEPKEYEIVVQKEGFCKSKKLVSLRAHEREKLHFVLSEVPTVRIVSKPSAKLWVDGTFLGETPASVKLTVGEHEVKLERTDFFSLLERINVSDEDLQQFEFSLTPSARLLVQASPPHAVVQIEDRSQRQPASFADLPLGMNTVVVKAAGYEEKRLEFDLKQGQNFLYVSLEPKVFRLDIVAPKEAMIFVDGKSVGRGPTSVRLAQAVHLIEARWGEKQWMGLVDLSSEEQIEVNFDVATVLLLGDKNTVYTVEGIVYRPPSLIYLPEGFHTVKMNEKERTIEFRAGKLYSFSPEELGYLCVFSDSVVECYVNFEFVGLSPVLFYPVKPGVSKVSVAGWERDVLVEPAKITYVIVGGD
ncbi:PEGA domain-containing protein [Pseudothermotoga sp.]